MTSSLPSPKPRAFTKWLDAGTTPVAAVDQAGRLQFHNDAFAPFLEPNAPELLPSELIPPAEAWNGIPCQRSFQRSPNNTEPHQRESNDTTAGANAYNLATYLPLADQEHVIYGCLITLSSALVTSTLARANSDSLQKELLEFRQRWSDAIHMDVLCGNSAQIRKTLQQVQLAIATHTPVLIRGYDLNTCHDLAKGIWLQRFKRSQLSSAGFQFMPLTARSLDGEMFRSALDLALPLRMHGEYLETCLLIEDVTALPEGAQAILADWLSNHRPPQIFATELLASDREAPAAIRNNRAINQYLGVLVIDIPSLLERPEDILVIATRILNASQSAPRGTTFAFSSSAAEALIAYPWHGDLNELRSLIQSISLAANKFVVEVSDLPLVLRSYIGGKATPTPHHSSIDLDQTLLELEKSLLEKTLLESRGNRALTARRLGISRARLLRRLAQLNIVASETELATDSDLEPELIDHSNSTKKDVTTTTSKSTTAAREPERPKTNIASDDFTAIDFVPVDDETTP
jgi:transcriptional regulator of aromatic amino acid metabolism